jgi:hypothetical protein
VSGFPPGEVTLPGWLLTAAEAIWKCELINPGQRLMAVLMLVHSLQCEVAIPRWDFRIPEEQGLRIVGMITTAPGLSDLDKAEIAISWAAAGPATY